MTDVFRNWIIILVALSAGLAIAAAVGDGTSPAVGDALTAVILLAAAGIGIIDATKRIIGQTSLLGRGRGAGRLLAILQLFASIVLAVSVLIS